MRLLVRRPKPLTTLWSFDGTRIAWLSPNSPHQRIFHNLGANDDSRSKTILPLLLGLVLFGCGGDTTSPSSSSAGDSSTTTAASTSADVGNASASRTDRCEHRRRCRYLRRLPRDPERLVAGRGWLRSEHRWQPRGKPGGRQWVTIARTDSSLLIGSWTRWPSPFYAIVLSSSTANSQVELHFTPSSSALEDRAISSQGVSVRERRGDHRWDDPPDVEFWVGRLLGRPKNRS